MLRLFGEETASETRLPQKPPAISEIIVKSFSLIIRLISFTARIDKANKSGTERFFLFSGGKAVRRKIHQTMHSNPEHGLFIKQAFTTAVTIVETTTMINVKRDPNCCST